MNELFLIIKMMLYAVGLLVRLMSFSCKQYNAVRRCHAYRRTYSFLPVGNPQALPLHRDRHALFHIIQDRYRVFASRVVRGKYYCSAMRHGHLGHFGPFGSVPVAAAAYYRYHFLILAELPDGAQHV